MAKNLLQDVVPPPRRSIRNVPVPAYRKKDTPPINVPFVNATVKAPSKNIQESIPPVTTPKKNLRLSDLEMAPPITPPKKRRWILWLTLGIVLAISVVILMNVFFTSATISITPKQQHVVLDEIVRAGDVSDGVPYEIITLSKTEGKSVPATENETVEERASGTIVIYNNHSTVSQRLVKNTRFETPEGLIYRIQESVNVPGQSTKAGTTVPGSAEALVYADAPGEKYNVAQTDFAIPGFKGDPKYKTFYARSKTAIEGGFIGVRKKVSEDIKETAISELKNILTTKLAQEAREQVPQNFVMFDEVLFVEFENAPQTDITTSSVTINLKGTARVAIFDKDLLETFIATEVAPALNNEEVEFSDIVQLTATVSNKQLVDIKNHTIFEMNLTGEGTVFTVFPEEQIKTELAGNPKSVMQTVLSKYSSVQEASARLSPIWKRSFPENTEDIRIIKVLLSE